MKPTIYLDCDGVVADFMGGVEPIVGRRLQHSQEYYTPDEWARIKQNPHIFRNLPLMPLAHNFVTVARQFRDVLGYDLVFLTAIPHQNDIPWAFWDKMAWAQQHWPDIAVHFGPYGVDKHKRAAPNNILVDDRPDTCKRWTESGGTAVLVPTNNEIQGLKKLEQIYQEKVSLINLRMLSNTK
jgi:5'(3')-deoxyribonucleotidase